MLPNHYFHISNILGLGFKSDLGLLTTTVSFFFAYFSNAFFVVANSLRVSASAFFQYCEIPVITLRPFVRSQANSIKAAGSDKSLSN